MKKTTHTHTDSRKNTRGVCGAIPQIGIQKVVRQHLSEIRYRYLLANGTGILTKGHKPFADFKQNPLPFTTPSVQWRRAANRKSGFIHPRWAGLVDSRYIYTPWA